MDPKLFAIDYTQTAEVMAVLVLLALFVERSLALLFESKIYQERFSAFGIRPLIALIWSCAVVSFYKFDSVAIILSEGKNSWFGYFLTASIVAGGSKVVIKLMQDVLKVQTYSKPPKPKK